MEARLAAVEQWMVQLDVEGSIRKVQAESEGAIERLLKQISEREAAVFAGLKSMQGKLAELGGSGEVQSATKALIEMLQNDVVSLKSDTASIRGDVASLQKRDSTNGKDALRTQQTFTEELLGVIEAQRKLHERLSATEESHATLLPLHNAHDMQLAALSLRCDEHEKRLLRVSEDVTHNEACHSAVEDRLNELKSEARSRSEGGRPAGHVDAKVIEKVDRLSSQQLSSEDRLVTLSDRLAESHSQLLESLERKQASNAHLLNVHVDSLSDVRERLATLECNGSYVLELSQRVDALEAQQTGGAAAQHGDSINALRDTCSALEEATRSSAAQLQDVSERNRELEVLVVGQPHPEVLKQGAALAELKVRVQVLETNGGYAVDLTERVQRLDDRSDDIEQHMGHMAGEVSRLTGTTEQHHDVLSTFEHKSLSALDTLTEQYHELAQRIAQHDARLDSTPAAGVPRSAVPAQPAPTPKSFPTPALSTDAELRVTTNAFPAPEQPGPPMSPSASNTITGLPRHEYTYTTELRGEAFEVVSRTVTHTDKHVVIDERPPSRSLTPVAGPADLRAGAQQPQLQQLQQQQPQQQPQHQQPQQQQQQLQQHQEPLQAQDPQASMPTHEPQPQQRQAHPQAQLRPLPAADTVTPRRQRDVAFDNSPRETSPSSLGSPSVVHASFASPASVEPFVRSGMRRMSPPPSVLPHSPTAPPPSGSTGAVPQPYGSPRRVGFSGRRILPATAAAGKHEEWRKGQVMTWQTRDVGGRERRSPSPFEEVVLGDSQRQCHDARRALQAVRSERRRMEDELAGVCTQVSKIQLSFKQLSVKQETMDRDARVHPPTPESEALRAKLDQVTSDITVAKHNILRKEKILCEQTSVLRSKIGTMRQQEHELLTDLSRLEPLSELARERSPSPGV